MRPIRLCALPFAFLFACGGGDAAKGEPNVIVTAPGTTTGTTITKLIGTAGGMLSDGHVALAIPAGALAADTTISITPITNTAPLGGQLAYRFEPEGTTFAVPGDTHLRLR